MLKWILKKWDVVAWTGLIFHFILFQAQDRDRWQERVGVVVILWDPYNEGNFLTS